jgi:hypothetical protein
MNPKLVLNILSTINGGLITGAALFTPLIGQDLTTKVIAGLGIAQIIVAGISSNLSTQTNLVKDVAAMPGVDKITVNNAATPALASLAVDSTQAKVAPANGNRPTLEQIAKGA